MKNGLFIQIIFCAICVVTVTHGEDLSRSNPIDNYMKHASEENPIKIENSTDSKGNHNSFLEVTKIIGGTFIILFGTGKIILADSPKCDDDETMGINIDIGFCVKGTPHPTREKIIGASAITLGGGLIIWGAMNLFENESYRKYKE